MLDQALHRIWKFYASAVASLCGVILSLSTDPRPPAHSLPGPACLTMAGFSYENRRGIRALPFWTELACGRWTGGHVAGITLTISCEGPSQLTHTASAGC